MTAAWVDGFITGANQYSSDTYDLMSFESTELLLSVVNAHCEKNPQDPVYGVLNNLFESLRPDRLTEKSDKTVVAVGEREAHHYQSLIGRVQEQLKARGFYDDPVNSAFSLQTIEAVKRYQQSVNLNPTGFPDQVTLWRLLRRGNETDPGEQ